MESRGSASSRKEQHQQLSFDPSDPTTYSLDALRGMKTAELLTIFNAVPMRATNSIEDPIEVSKIKTIMLQAICVAFASFRRKEEDHTIARTEMFAGNDGSSKFRPTLGLKRTFRTRIQDK